MKELYIMIGVSGSGKTTWIRKNLKNAFVGSADNYFVGVDGIYRFNGDKISQAHEYCKQRILLAMNGKEQTIVLDNQNLLASQRAVYEELAKKHGYSINYVCFEKLPAKVLAERNVHGLEEKKIASCLQKIQYPTSGNLIWVTAEELTNEKKKEN